MQFVGAVKKVASLNLWRQNAKWRKPPSDSTVIEPKYARIPMFLHIPLAHEQGQIYIHGFVGKICLGKRFLHFWNPTSAPKKTENNFSRVPIHFATDRFTWETSPPPPLFLLPNIYLRTHTHTYIHTYIHTYMHTYTHINVQINRSCWRHSSQHTG